MERPFLFAWTAQEFKGGMHLLLEGACVMKIYFILPFAHS